MDARPAPAYLLALDIADVDDDPGECRALLESAIASCSDLELAGLQHDWSDWWARPSQVAPPGAWLSWGALTGRGWGKTATFAEYVTGEALSGRAMRIAIMAQTLDDTIAVMVLGESGLIATSPPWAKATFEVGDKRPRVRWPNGAQAFVYSAREPRSAFGPEHHLAWVSEVHQWQVSSREEAWANLDMGVRLGYARTVWDSNPQRRHPIIRRLLDRGEKRPERHVVVRGSTHENAANIAQEKIREWEDEYGGTTKGREMLLGEQLDESEAAIFRQAWIDDNRRSMPGKLERRVLSVDPAISTRAGTDWTGIVDIGLGVDGQVFVLDDLSAAHTWEAWGALVVATYFERRCDCVLIERNRGGDACVANLRAACRDRGIALEVLDLAAKPRHVPGVLYVKEIVSRSSKEVRAEAVAPMYEKGKVSHVKGARLDSLEDQMCSWEPDPKADSPNAMDALVHGVWELAGLWGKQRDAGAGIAGGAVAAAAIRGAAASTLASVLGAGRPAGWGGRI